ncbi:MAG: LytR/AlgR family response regulator transcription factor [Prevotella sp.]
MIRCIAIDDEPIALGIIEQYCNIRGGIELETYSTPRHGMQRVLDTKPDIVFLDIELNGISGIEFARQLPASCCLIFTTAYAHYALEGFEVNAIDFLHKPFFYERFARAMSKAEEWIRARDLINSINSDERRLVVKQDYKNVSIAIDTISYIEALENYVRIHKIDGTKVTTKMPLHAIEQLLPDDMFLRIHRSFIVSRKRISQYTRTEMILMDEPRPLPIGKKYAKDRY